jgi:hypothetical protein
MPVRLNRVQFWAKIFGVKNRTQAPAWCMSLTYWAISPPVVFVYASVMSMSVTAPVSL